MTTLRNFEYRDGRRIESLLIGLITLTLVAGASAVAQAQSGNRAGSASAQDAEDTRWLPGLAIQTGILAQMRDGMADSEERGPVVGDTTALFGTFGARAELSTPRIDFIPSRPRFFAHADVSLSLDNDEAVANQGAPGDPIRNPENDVSVGDPVAGVIDVGTSLRSQSEPLILGGGMGLSFSGELGGRKVSLRPSLEWMFQRDEISVAFGHAESVGSDPTRCAPCRTVAATAQATKGYHSLGPGIEVDVDAGRVGDFKLSLFTQFSALRILGDRQVNLRATGSWFTREDVTVNGENIILSIDPDTGRADSSVTARYRRDPWSYAATAGIRIVWSPE